MNSAVVVAPVRGILWRDWRAHRTLVYNFLTAWLICLWILPVFSSPAWILAFGVLYACVAAPAVGGSEVQEGSEEFSLALPPTRGERYVARLLLGLAPVAGFVGIGNLAIALSLPQRLWGLFFESGYTEPFPPTTNALLLPLSLVGPPALFATAYALAAVVPTRKLVSSSWFFAGGLAGAAVGLGLSAENLLWQSFNGWIAVPALAALGIGAAAGGHRLYLRKEAVEDPDTGGSGWIVGAAALLILFLLFLIWVS